MLRNSGLLLHTVSERRKGAVLHFGGLVDDVADVHLSTDGLGVLFVLFVGDF